MSETDLFAAIERLRNEAEHAKAQLANFEEEALALQSSILAAIERLTEYLGHAIVLLETGKPKQAKDLLLAQIALLQSIALSRLPSRID